MRESKFYEIHKRVLFDELTVHDLLELLNTCPRDALIMQNAANCYIGADIQLKVHNEKKGVEITFIPF